MFAATLLIGCGAKQNQDLTPQQIRANELKVMVGFLTDQFSYSLKENGILIIEAKTSIAMLRLAKQSDAELQKSLLSQASDQVPSDLVNDFCEKNAQPSLVWPEITSLLPSKLLPHEEMTALFSHLRGEKKDGWQRFYEKYPKSPGVITISRVGFNHNRDIAMLYYG